MSTELVERQQALASLSSAFASACAGAGRTVLLSGEAGVGKSSVTQHFLSLVRAHVRVFVGGCEVLSTPRPLGPIQDFAVAMGGKVLQLLTQGDKSAWIAQALLAELASTQTTVLVFEDVHWADHATLDILKYLGRRIGPLNALLLITYRDDEIPSEHPLHSVLADLPATSTSRVLLKPLSREAVDALMLQSGREIPRLFQVTRGNPFFVNALLATPEDDAQEAIASVKDMVLARLRRLGGSARELCEFVSMVPAQIEFSVLMLSKLMTEEELIEAIDACLLAGLLEQDATHLRFRHELARQVIESSLSTNRTRELHTRVFSALLLAPAISVARLVHHASKARLADRVLEFAPKAAAEARRLGAHREALTYYDHLRAQLVKAPRRTQAEILEGWAFSYAAVAWANKKVFEALLQAVTIWQELQDIERAGIALRLLAFGYWITGNRQQSVLKLDEAIALLESIEPTAALAIAYSMKTKVYLAQAESVQAISMGRRAIALGEKLGDNEARAHALTYLGTALLRAEQAEGALVLAEGIALGRTHGLHESTTDAYHNLTETLVKQYRLEEAKQTCLQALSFAGQMDISQAYLRGLEAQIAAFQGRYADALDSAKKSLTALPVEAGFVRWPALLAQGMALSRQGRAGAIEALNECLDIATRLEFTQDILPSAAALVEHLVFVGLTEKARQILASAWQKRGKERNSWMIGVLSAWGVRLGVALDSPQEQDDAILAKPFQLELQGKFADAALVWRNIGAPFEEAMALMHCGHSGILSAIEIFTRIGAQKALALANAEARSKGVRGVKRGRYRSANENSVGLTAREVQVLQLVSKGLSNAEIALQLRRSERTVEHHVSAMLGKTQTHNRVSLVKWALNSDMAAIVAAKNR